MKQTDLSRLAKEDIISIIGKEWMLITAGDIQHFNTMTASWGGVGFLWGKPVAFVFIRPERYTHDFVEQNDRLTLTFFDEVDKDILNFCGTKSGRDYDKVKETGLRPVATPGGNVSFDQARLTIEGRKLYKTRLTADGFIDKAALAQPYVCVRNAALLLRLEYAPLP